MPRSSREPDTTPPPAPIEPGLITAITPAPRKPGRFAVAIGGQDVATLSLDAIERLALGTGVLVTAEVARAMEREAAVLHVYDRALNMLASRGRSSVELRRLLVRKGEAADVVDAAIVRLREVGFLDDAAFARSFTRSRALGGGVSRRRVQQELGKRGVAREVADDAIREVFEEEAVDEAAAIEQVARKKARTLLQYGGPTRRRRLYGFLARRGYDADAIARVLRVVLADAPADASGDADDGGSDGDGEGPGLADW